jgi:outer membrane protein, heavy metal efflux system
MLLVAVLSCAPSTVLAHDDAAKLVTAAVSAQTLDPLAYVRAVLAVHPSLEAAQLSWRAAKARTRQAGQLGDPMIHASLAPLSLAASQHRVGFELGLSQELPWFGNLAIERRALAADEHAMQHDFETARRELAITARLLYDQYYVVERSLEINAEHVTLVNALKETVAAQRSDGRGTAQDVLQAEAQLATLERESLSLSSERAVVVAQLNELLRRAPDAQLPPPLAELPRAASTPEERKQRSQLTAATDRTEVRAAGARVRAEALKGEAAERGYFPSFRLSTSYSSMWEMAAHRWMVGVELNVPWPSERKSAVIDEARALRARYESELVQLTDAARTEVFVAARKLTEAEDSLALLETRQIPLAAEQIAAARSAFMSSRASLLSVLEAERMLRSAELERELMRAECDRRGLALQRALGRAPGLDSVESKP